MHITTTLYTACTFVTLILIVAFPVQASSFVWSQGHPPQAARPERCLLPDPDTFLSLSPDVSPSQKVMPPHESVTTERAPQMYGLQADALPPLMRHATILNSSKNPHRSWAAFFSSAAEIRRTGSTPEPLSSAPPSPGDSREVTPGETAPDDVTSSTNTTPIPMISWLLGAGILGLIGFSRKPC